MKTPRARLQTAAELAAIRTRVDERHEDYLRQFAALVAGQVSMNAKLDSLLASRSFYRGAAKMALTVSSAVSVLIGLVFGWYKH